MNGAKRRRAPKRQANPIARELSAAARVDNTAKGSRRLIRVVRIKQGPITMHSRLLAIAVAAFFVALAASFSEAAEPLVGAYYYPWYGSFAGGHPWNQTLREHLSPQQPPAPSQPARRN